MLFMLLTMKQLFEMVGLSICPWPDYSWKEHLSDSKPLQIEDTLELGSLEEYSEGVVGEWCWVIMVNKAIQHMESQDRKWTPYFELSAD